METFAAPKNRARVTAGLLTAILLTGLCSIARADILYYNQTENTDWFEPLNWSGTAIPTSADEANIQSGTAVISAPGAVANAVAVTDTLLLDGPSATLAVTQGMLVGIDTLTPASLTVQSGATLTSANGYFGWYDDTTATGLITGQDSTWTNTGDLQIGYGQGSIGQVTVSENASVSAANALELGNGNGAAGSLTINSSGTVSAGQLKLGLSDAASGEIIVENNGSQLNITGDADIGLLGSGTATIQSGGVFTVGGDAYIAGGSGSSASSTVTVDGAGSRWDVAGRLSVGEFSTGTLAVQNGGVVTSGEAVISRNTNGRGTAVVDGAGSQWTVAGNLGFGRSGTITVSNGGALVSGTNEGAATTIDHNGTLTVTGNGSFFASPNYLDIGRSGAGTFTVADGAIATTGLTTIGIFSSGTVTVDGAGSYWTILGEVDSPTYLGYSRNAIVTVSNGGVVENQGITSIGYTSSSTNSILTVTGAGSAWNSAGDLITGGGGSRGRIVVSDGGSLSNAAANLSAGSSVSVTGPDSTWNSTGLLSLPSGTLTFQDNANVSSGDAGLGTVAVTVSGTSQWNGSGQFTLTSGTLAILDGSTFSFTGPTNIDGGTITVSGSSQWSGDGANLATGDTVHLTIDTGGVVNWSSQATLATGASAQAIVTVSGSVSQLNASGGLTLGDFGGSGSISVTQGGALSTGIASLDGGSTISIDGAGSSLSTGSSLTVASGSITLANGSTAYSEDTFFGSTGSAAGRVSGSSQWTASNMTIGNGSTGTFVVDSGGQVEVSVDTIVGGSGTGSVLVSGTGSKWSNGGHIRIGTDTLGTFTVQDGAELSSNDSTTIDRRGTLTVTGTGSSFNGATVVVGNSRGGTFNMLNGATGTIGGLTVSGVSSVSSSTSTLLIDGAGSSLTSSGITEIGNRGNGNATVSNGGQMNDDGVTLGNGNSGTGTLTVTGTGSQWNSNGDLIVGVFNRGTVNILNGGAISSSNGVLGDGGGGIGSVTVDGIGSQWTLADALNIGNQSTGILTVSNGGKVTSSYTLIGDTSGTATVTGTGSQWTVGDLTVGIRGQGTLTVSNGGLVTGTNGLVGDTSMGTGTVNVTGTGSRWTMTGDLTVGNEGVGTLTISQGGQVTSASGLLGSSFSGDGAVTVTGTGSRWNVSGGLTVGDVGTGSLTVVNGGTLTTAASIIGTGNGDNNATALVSGTGSVWAITTSSGTALVIGSALGSAPASLTIENGGQVNVSALQQVIVNQNASLFIGTGSAGGTLTTTGLENRGLLSFNHSDNISFTGGIGNFGTIIKAGTGTLTITGAINDGGGSVELNGGTLRIGSGGTLGGLTGDVSSSSNTILAFNKSDTITYTSNYSGGGALYQIGSGTLNLGGDNTYTGNTFVQAGALRLTTTTALPAGGRVNLAGGSLLFTSNTNASFSGANVVVASNGTISGNRSSSTANVTYTMGTISIGSQALTFAQGTTFGTNNVGSYVTGAVSLTGNPTLNFTNTRGTGVGTTTFGALSDSGTARTITKTGAATLLLGTAAGSLTSGGSLVVNQGLVQANTANTLGSSALVNVVVNGTTAGTTSFALNNVNQSILSLTFGGIGATTTSTNSVTVGTGTLTLGGNVTYDATNNPAGSTISGNLALGSATRTFNIGNSTTAANDLTVSAIISGAGGLTKTGAGTLLLSGANTYTGTTTVSSGTLTYGANNILANAGAVNVDGGAFNVLTFSDTVGAITLASGAIVGTTGTLTGSSYAVQSGTISARLAGTGALTKTTSGFALLSGTSSYTGGTFVNGGTLAFGASNLLANSGTVSVGGGTLDIGAFSDTVGPVALTSGAIVGTTGTLTATSYAVQSGTISAILAGSGGLAKTTSGTALLSGSNRYTGTTAITAGTLVVGSNSAAGQSVVTVDTGATFLIETGVSISNTVQLKGGSLDQKFASGANLANVPVVTSDLPGGSDTTSTILAGTTSATATLSSTFSLTSSASNDGIRRSDVLHFSGVPVVSGTTTDIFVLKLSMTSVAPGSMLGWLNDSDLWVNAVTGNTGNNASGAQLGFLGDFVQFQLTYGATLSNYIGAWGRDGTSVWAVLNHNSDFAIVPEPNIWALLAVAMGFAVVSRRRVRVG